MRRTLFVFCIIVIGILLGTFLTSSASASSPSITVVRAKHERSLLAIKGVTGVATDKSANQIVVYTETQQDCANVPKELNGFTVRCEAIGRIEAIQPAAAARPTQWGWGFLGSPPLKTYSRTGVDRPFFGGISVGSSAYPSSAGTLGLVTGSGQILSCAHVLAMDTSGRLLTTADTWQPGGYDRGNSANSVIGPHPTTYTTIVFNDDAAKNTADAAYTTTTCSTGSYKPDMVLNAANTGWVTISYNPNAAAKPGDVVSKSGRSTGVTTGVVSQTGATVKVWYSNSEYAVFQNQIVIFNRSFFAPFCAPGDSGSVIYNSQNQFVGLLFAASTNQFGFTQVTIANTASNVMSGLRLSKI